VDNLTSDILTGFGLSITLAGAAITASAVILKDDDAIKTGTTRVVANNHADRIHNPVVQNLLASSRGARRGLLFIAGGTALQIVPIAVRLVSLAFA
jgi:hypothetical protein